MKRPMRKLLSICVGLAMMLTAATAMAADVTGRWSGAVAAPDGTSIPITFTFKQDGATLTGSVQLMQNDPIAISNGKVDGDKFSFDDSFNGVTISHQCMIDGDTIKMTTKSDSPDIPGVELMLTRVKDAAQPATPTAPTGVSGTAVPQ